jgi:pimeloyl-ACP methyl ester carboxylesterase
MPFANNQGIRIHYEVEGAGPPLVLLHGTVASGEDWREFGYTDVLKQNHQLIIMDARGHGASDKPHDPAAYDMALRVADVAAVLDELQIRRAHFLGYSMGGWIGFGLGKYAPERFQSLILGGAHPYAEVMRGYRDGLSNGPEKFDAWIAQIFGHYMTPSMSKRLLENDLAALLALSQDRADFASVLQTMHMPCLLYVGEADPRLAKVRECVEQLADATFFSLPECSHIDAFARSDLVLPHVTTFLTRLRQ